LNIKAHSDPENSIPHFLFYGAEVMVVVIPVKPDGVSQAHGTPYQHESRLRIGRADEEPTNYQKRLD
jgi:hypothetical protein